MPLEPGTRDQVEVGVQQALGHWIVADLGYFYKHTTNAYDFGVLFDTPIFFPICLGSLEDRRLHRRASIWWSMEASARSRSWGTPTRSSFPPGTGGLLLEQPDGDFRIDHDQKFQQTTNLQYLFSKAVGGAWVALSWRYDSGLVAGSVPTTRPR